MEEKTEESLEQEVESIRESSDNKSNNIEENLENSYESQDDEPSRTQEIFKEIRSYFLIVMAAILVAIVVNTFLLSNTRIPTGSMENTINCGDRLFGNRLAYKFEDVKRQDIIIFKFPDNQNINYIKRVIGLPGDTVRIEDGVVYVNDEILKEDYLKEPFQGDFGPYEVPEDSYFVMGDNRNNSNDARYWNNTYVHEDDIIAKAGIRYWPSIKVIK
ncbi:MAG: signal peptidase I [Lachnospiraceae bacterium]|nr:signal peptidase I [Lachnospiraceae bacterium]